MKAFKYFLSIIFFLFFFTATQAQDDIPQDEDVVPVDGGIGLLLAAGAAWGIKKLKDKN